MTYFYKTYSWGNNSTQGISEETRTLWEHIAKKENWRIVQLPNGFFQAEYKDLSEEEKWIDVTRRETLESCEAAIDGSISHYSKKLEFLKGPKVVKTFK
jgi:hypothetical protein|tara:strand:+ start:173 stop:469 length:297 start_codon:yes stop_codon:yes gene_type:complete